MKTFTATQLNKSPQEIFAAANQGVVMIEHDRYTGRFFIINAETIEVMAAYVLSHEQDISSGINDFDELKEVFSTLIGRDAGN